MSDPLFTFRNEPLTDFTIEKERLSLFNAIVQIEDEISRSGLRSSPIVNGEIFGTNLQIIAPLNPSNSSQVLGSVYLADESITQQALDCAKNYLPNWQQVTVEERASVLKKAAFIMRHRKHELSARIILECGKTWKEADADVAEAIDFCEYYADAAKIMLNPRRTQNVPGEDDIYRYFPRGVSIVIAPWNFPLAIACGMTVASLVTGNTTILKPAEQSSFIAYTFAQILYEAGVPNEAFHLLPGLGEVVGKKLCKSPDTSMICFTGSKAVGLEILKDASVLEPNQTHLKKVILELGGKNAIIVDEDADLDEAIKGILYSSFGFAGQKCSACSRLIVVGSAYQPLLSRLKDAVSDLIVGDAKDPGSYLGPVIDSEAYNRILSTIQKGKTTLTLLTQGATSSKGYFVPPTIFSDVPTDSSLWTDEIFGPVLCAAKVDSFEEGIKLANHSSYALTGGVFSRNPLSIELSKQLFEVGNLYINRGCTGAMVGRQPFGGFKLSGIGSKAGGPDYLLQFVEPRHYAENTMRRGFVG